MIKIPVFFGTTLWLLFFLPLIGLSQVKKGSEQPDTKAKKSISKPDQRKAPSKALIEVFNQALKEQEKVKQTEKLKADQQKDESSLGYEIDGLLIDETLTKFGHDFYDIFYSGWDAPPKINNYTIKIKEKPAIGRGFLITVLVNDEPIMEQNLQPNTIMIEETANYAIALTTDYLNNYENLKNQIESDDQKGTGIF